MHHGLFRLQYSPSPNQKMNTTQKEEQFFANERSIPDNQKVSRQGKINCRQTKRNCQANKKEIRTNRNQIPDKQKVIWKQTEGDLQKSRHFQMNKQTLLGNEVTSKLTES